MAGGRRAQAGWELRWAPGGTSTSMESRRPSKTDSDGPRCSLMPRLPSTPSDKTPHSSPAPPADLCDSIPDPDPTVSVPGQQQSGRVCPCGRGAGVQKRRLAPRERPVSWPRGEGRAATRVPPAAPTHRVQGQPVRVGGAQGRHQQAHRDGRQLLRQDGRRGKRDAAGCFTGEETMRGRALLSPQPSLPRERTRQAPGTAG